MNPRPTSLNERLDLLTILFGVNSLMLQRDSDAVQSFAKMQRFAPIADVQSALTGDDHEFSEFVRNMSLLWPTLILTAPEVVTRFLSPDEFRQRLHLTAWLYPEDVAKSVTKLGASLDEELMADLRERFKELALADPAPLKLLSEFTGAQLVDTRTIQQVTDLLLPNASFWSELGRYTPLGENSSQQSAGEFAALKLLLEHKVITPNDVAEALGTLLRSDNLKERTVCPRRRSRRPARAPAPRPSTGARPPAAAPAAAVARPPRQTR